MKAKIVQDKIWGGYWWLILYSNGAVAAEGPEYTRRDNAIRGLRNFVDNFSTVAALELNSNSDENVL